MCNFAEHSNKAVCLIGSDTVYYAYTGWKNTNSKIYVQMVFTATPEQIALPLWIRLENIFYIRVSLHLKNNGIEFLCITMQL